MSSRDWVWEGFFLVGSVSFDLGLVTLVYWAGVDKDKYWVECGCKFWFYKNLLEFTRIY